MEMGFRWDFAYEILPQMLWATLNTIIAAGVGYAIALVVGLFFLLGQRTPSKIINGINREIVEFIRSTPLLIQLFFVYFVLPQFGIKLSAWVCGPSADVKTVVVPEDIFFVYTPAIDCSNDCEKLLLVVVPQAFA